MTPRPPVMTPCYVQQAPDAPDMSATSKHQTSDISQSCWEAPFEGRGRRMTHLSLRASLACIPEEREMVTGSQWNAQGSSRWLQLPQRIRILLTSISDKTKTHQDYEITISWSHLSILQYCQELCAWWCLPSFLTYRHVSTPKHATQRKFQ